MNVCPFRENYVNYIFLVLNLGEKEVKICEEKWSCYPEFRYDDICEVW
jgi:hypothetical protein